VRVRASLSLTIVLAILLPANPATSQSSAPAHLLAKGALALIETSDKLGSGFAVSRTIVATNCHVIRGAASIQLHFWAAKKQAPGRQVVCDERRDVAFIAVAVPEETEILAFATERPMQGQWIWVWGFPLGRAIATEPSLSQGIISATDSQPGYVVLESSGAPGSSGGPVVGVDGRVVGIFTGSVGTGGSGASGFKVAVTAATASEVLRNAGNVPPPPGAATAQATGVTVRPGDGVRTVRVGMTPEQVESSIGLPPTGRSETCATWGTRQIMVCFSGGKAIAILTQDPRDSAPQGVKLGTTDAELVAALGRPRCSRISSFDGKPYLSWHYDGLTFWLEGTPRRVIGMIVWERGFVSNLCN
jgi:trypsin-like peptidase